MAKILENLGRRYVLQAGSKKIEWPRKASDERLQKSENSNDNFSDFQPLDHSFHLQRLPRPSILRRTSRQDVERVVSSNACEYNSEYNQRKLQWYDEGSPDLRSKSKTDGIRNREITMNDGRLSKQSQFSKGRSLSGTRSLYKGSDHLPYFRSKSVHDLDTESVMSQFRPVLNHKAVIDHTYNIERSRSRSKSREGFVRKRVVTTPLAMREEQRERTLYTDRYRGMKDVYTESNTEHVEKQFYKRLADVKMEEFRSVSRSTDKNSKQRKKVLLKQIQDLRKINTRYGRAVEKRYKSKFSVYHPTDTAARFKNTTGVNEKAKYSHDFSKWRHKEQELKSDEHSPDNNMMNNNQKYVKKGRSYKRPSWEKEGRSYMERLKQQEANEDASSGDSEKMREMLKEAENMLNEVEHNFPGAVGTTNQDTAKYSPTKRRSPTDKTHSRSRSQNIDKRTRSRSRSQNIDETTRSKSRSQNIAETFPDQMKTAYTNSDINTRHRNLNLTGSVRERSSHQYSLSHTRQDRPVISGSLSDYKLPIESTPDKKLNSRSARSKPTFRFERSKSLNPSLYNSKQMGELRKQTSNPGITRTASGIHKNNSVPNFRLPKLSTDGSVERFQTRSNTMADYKDIKAKHRHSSGSHERSIVIRVPRLPVRYSEDRKRDKAPTKLLPACEENGINITENIEDLKTDAEDAEVLTNNTKDKDLERNESRRDENGSSVPPNLEQQHASSGYTVRIDAPNNQLHEGANNNRKTPVDVAVLSRQSLRRTPISIPNSREKLTATNDRILITPISLKNKGPALLVANYRIITPVVPTNENMDSVKEQVQNGNGDFFLTFVDAGNQQTSLQIQEGETVQSGEINTVLIATKEGKGGEENSLPKENTEDAICLEKWKSLVQHYLTESDSGST